MLQAVKNTLILLKQLALESVAFPELEPLAIRFFPVVKRALHTNTNESACASVLVFVFLWMAQREFRKRPAKCQSGALSPPHPFDWRVCWFLFSWRQSGPSS